mmetsp:Transcript_10667/g.24270  ORF Transcript_10667/g.24270 Transcript_10667/m.24270 type:complete len:231 (-) Transcript_10667:1430-2122(-)
MALHNVKLHPSHLLHFSSEVTRYCGQRMGRLVRLLLCANHGFLHLVHKLLEQPTHFHCFFCMCQSQHLAPLAAIIGDVSTHDVQLVVQAHEGLLYVTHIGRMHNIILSKLPAHARHCSFVVGKKVLNIHGCPPTLAVHPNNLGELVVEDELLEGLWRAQALHHTINKVAEGDLSMPQDVQAVKEELTISISALCLTFVFDDFKVRRRCVLHEISLQLFPGLLAENMQCIF